jgi:hypothetical protein
MNVLRLDDTPSPALAAALRSFEREFTYPLGSSNRFHISHGDDYLRFFRAIGRASCFIAEDAGVVLGTIAVVRRRVGMPDGTEKDAAYLADLKARPDALRGRVLLRLVRELQSMDEAPPQAAFGIVMDGTRAVPTQYTGRMGIPLFKELAKLVVLHCTTSSGQPVAGIAAVEATSGDRLYRKLSYGRLSTPGGSPFERSQMAPEWLSDENGEACGCIEDTRAAKRLWTQGGEELISAHLSAFAYQSVTAGVRLLLEACRRAADRGFGKVFVAVASADASAFRSELGRAGATEAPATVYGYGLADGLSWNANTAEI